MTRDPDCVFCKIVSVEIPASVVYEDDALVCFLDASPLAAGHLLIVTRQHFAKLTDLPTEVASKVGAVLPVVGRTLLEVTGAIGLNVLCNEGTAAGQVVEHVHFHLIPREGGDGLGYRWPATSYSDGQAAELTAAYLAAFARRK